MVVAGVVIVISDRFLIEL